MQAQAGAGVVVRYTTRPLSDRAWLRADSARRSAPFRLTWPRIEQKLFDEVEALDGSDLIIGLDITEADLRIDGRPRANARAASPAVEVAFESKHGPLLYRADNYGDRWYGREGWHENVYAVALTLEALRAVDRWGAASSGEQYRGYRQIGGGPAIVPEAPMTTDRAAEVIAKAGYPGENPRLVAAAIADGIGVEVAVRLAQRNTHPDARRPGVDVSFDDVQRAAAHLRGQS